MLVRWHAAVGEIHIHLVPTARTRRASPRGRRLRRRAREADHTGELTWCPGSPGVFEPAYRVPGTLKSSLDCPVLSGREDGFTSFFCPEKSLETRRWRNSRMSDISSRGKNAAQGSIHSATCRGSDPNQLLESARVVHARAHHSCWPVAVTLTTRSPSQNLAPSSGSRRPEADN